MNNNRFWFMVAELEFRNDKSNPDKGSDNLYLSLIWLFGAAGCRAL